MISDNLKQGLSRAPRIWLFLDYDGTLADFAPTPDHVFPDPELINLLGRIAHTPRIHLAIISGRRLAHLEKLIPLQNLTLAGTYGIELRLPGGEHLQRLPFATIRPALERIHPLWQTLIASRKGFYLEDKGWSLALHARDAEDVEAKQVLAQAQTQAQTTQLPDIFKFLGGHKFLEICPQLADKGETIRFLLREEKAEGTILVYLGDDDKDENAFQVIHEYDGLAGLVAESPKETHADFRLESPQVTRYWLAKNFLI